jgi:hypothetical protein
MDGDYPTVLMMKHIAVRSLCTVQNAHRPEAYSTHLVCSVAYVPAGIFQSILAGMCADTIDASPCISAWDVRSRRPNDKLEADLC